MSISYRLGGPDGVSIEAEKWQWALRTLGFQVRTVAGSGPVDVAPARSGRGRLADRAGRVPPLDRAPWRRPWPDADLVVVENLCSLPLNPAAADAVAAALAGRPAILRHHDLPWQRDRFAGSRPHPTTRPGCT